MATPYAEVIGDPVAHSKSPLIHRFWLEKLGLVGEYRAVRVQRGEAAAYLKMRCSDPCWRGCNVTAPLKKEAAQIAVDPIGLCRRIGAVNAVFRSPLGCGIGANTDLEGIGAAIGEVTPGIACIIGAGGAARTAVEYLRLKQLGEVRILARQPSRAKGPGKTFRFDEAAAAMAGADLVINATPLGMTGMPPMPDALLSALERTADHATIFDMVYTPVDTQLLLRARSLGRATADGLSMLVGQAAPSFALFFGPEPPRAHDQELRRLLVS